MRENSLMKNMSGTACSLCKICWTYCSPCNAISQIELLNLKSILNISYKNILVWGGILEFWCENVAFGY